VRHRPEADVLVPQVRRTREESAGIEVEVLLGVGADATGRGEQERHVREQREGDQLDAPVRLDNRGFADRRGPRQFGGRHG
jgi:hypothetical protein